MIEFRPSSKENTAKDGKFEFSVGITKKKNKNFFLKHYLLIQEKGPRDPRQREGMFANIFRAQQQFKH